MPSPNTSTRLNFVSSFTYTSSEETITNAVCHSSRLQDLGYDAAKGTLPGCPILAACCRRGLLR